MHARWLDTAEIDLTIRPGYEELVNARMLPTLARSHATILIVDDDPKLVATLVRYVAHAGWRVVCASDGVTALRLARAERPDLVVLDRMLPELDGISVCRLLREESNVPIVMLTARSTEDDRLEGLDVGADDYVVKPFSPRELIARVRAVLRRSAPPAKAADAPSRVIQAGEVEIDESTRGVVVRGNAVSLTATEFALLTTLAAARGRVFTRMELIERVFGSDHDGDERGMDVHVKNLRRKIEKDRDTPRLICTVFGIGYAFARAHRVE
jgi:DNA-binding response OmpR family regulator